jgi:hypothetical protein
LFLVPIWAARPWVSGDTPFVLDGTNALIECLSRRASAAASGELDYWGLMSQSVIGRFSSTFPT